MAKLTAESFQDAGLLGMLGSASPEEIDKAEFGIVGLSRSGRVEHYNAWESQLSGLRPERMQGKDFFTDVAPCTNNFMVALRFQENETLDETVPYVFTFRMKPAKVNLRLLKSPESPSQYLLVERAAE